MWIKVIDRTQKPQPRKPGEKPKPKEVRLKFEQVPSTVQPGTYENLPFPVEVAKEGQAYITEIKVQDPKIKSSTDALKDTVQVLPLGFAKKVYVWIPTWILILAALLILLIFALGVLVGWWLL